MCEFISGKHLVPGWACCGCKTYNGLQRDRCRGCASPHHELAIPDTIHRCPECGFGESVGEWQDMKGKCPVCAGQHIAVATKWMQ